MDSREGTAALGGGSTFAPNITFNLNVNAGGEDHRRVDYENHTKRIQQPIETEAARTGKQPTKSRSSQDAALWVLDSPFDSPFLRFGWCYVRTQHPNLSIIAFTNH